MRAPRTVSFEAAALPLGGSKLRVEILVSHLAFVFVISAFASECNLGQHCLVLAQNDPGSVIDAGDASLLLSLIHI